MNTTIDSRNYVGLLYHPIDLMNKIRFAMFRSGRVLFVSPNVNFNQPGPLHQNLSGIRVVTTTAMRNSHNINSFYLSFKYDWYKMSKWEFTITNIMVTQIFLR